MYVKLFSQECKSGFQNSQTLKSYKIPRNSEKLSRAFSFVKVSHYFVLTVLKHC